FDPGPVAGFMPGDNIRIQQTSSATANTPTTATVTIGTTTSGVWSARTVSDCTATPAAGAIFADGTIYAGLTPDGNVKMFTTPCDKGMTWNGGACTGARVGSAWNSGTTTSYPVTGITSTITGRANTMGLAALADA